MQNYVILGLVLILVVVALLHAKKHFQGGGCCGSDSGDAIHEHKQLREPKIGEKVLIVEGMRCENCAVRVENALNHLSGCACEVQLKKKTATVAFSAPVSDALLKETVEKLGYTVSAVREKEA